MKCSDEVLRTSSEVGFGFAERTPAEPASFYLTRG
jgi:hypothetical protein